MAISKVQICNMALSHIGGGRISSLDENSEKARQLNLNYDNCLETVLRAFPWNFARKIEILALTDDSTPGWRHVYQYPPNCANLLRIFHERYARKNDDCFKVEFSVFTNGTEKFIATDLEEAYAEITMRITNPTLYDPAFVKAFSYLLAAEICNAISGNAQKAEEMMQKYSYAVNEAKYAGANESNAPYKWPNSFIKGRR